MLSLGPQPKGEVLTFHVPLGWGPPLRAGQAAWEGQLQGPGAPRTPCPPHPDTTACPLYFTPGILFPSSREVRSPPCGSQGGRGASVGIRAQIPLLPSTQVSHRAEGSPPSQPSLPDKGAGSRLCFSGVNRARCGLIPQLGWICWRPRLQRLPTPPAPPAPRCPRPGVPRVAGGGEGVNGLAASTSPISPT